MALVSLIPFLQVTLLESSERVGGRVDTYYAEDGSWYGDLGAMRFPPKK